MAAARSLGGAGDVWAKIILARQMVDKQKGSFREAQKKILILKLKYVPHDMTLLCLHLRVKVLLVLQSESNLV